MARIWWRRCQWQIVVSGKERSVRRRGLLSSSGRPLPSERVGGWDRSGDSGRMRESSKVSRWYLSPSVYSGVLCRWFAESRLVEAVWQVAGACKEGSLTSRAHDRGGIVCLRQQ